MSMINKYEAFLGTGKSTLMTSATMYALYIMGRAFWLSDMKRIPRKLKKRMFKNVRIKSLYKEFRRKEK